MKMRALFVALLVGAFVVISGTSYADDVSGKIEKVNDGGRSIVVGGKTLKISGSRSKIKVKGEDGDRDSLKVGLDCKVAFDGEEAKTVNCK